MKKILILICLVLFSGVFFAEDEKDEPKYPVFDEVVKKAEKKEGFFNLYLEDNSLFMEVSADFLEKEFFFFSSFTGGMLSEFVPNYTLDQKVLYFKKIGTSLGLFEKSLYYTAEKDSPESLAVKQAYLDSLLFMFPIRAAQEGESAYLIDVNSWFFSADQFFPPWLQNWYGLNTDPQSSFWTITKTFPDNLELELQTTFFTRWGNGSSNQMRLYFSLVRKQESDYKPRIADERIGYFLNEVRDFSDLLNDQGYKRYINRWNLQKAVPKAKKSVVKKPIVYHIDKTVPYKYWRYIRDGVLEWNKAFEKLGFIGAVEVRLPDESADWDAMDVRYSTISWVADESAWAMGPSRVNPWTGEILCADIIIMAGFLDYYDYFTKLYGNFTVNGRLSAEKYMEIEKELAEFVKRGAHLRYYDIYRDLGRKLTIMAAQSTMLPGSEEFEKWRDELIGAALKDTVTHEVGHTLGLRHNFKGSSTVSVENLRNKEWTLQNQISDSVMDYGDWNLTANPENQGSYTMTSIGKYDYLAIEYGYKPLEEENEEEELNKIAASLRQQGLEYGTDEDEWFGMDPHCQAWDSGDDLVDSAVERIEVIKRIMSSVEKTVVSTGDNYFMVRRAVTSLLWAYNNKVFSVLPYIGGVYTRKDRVNDEGGSDPFTPVSLEQQQKTIDFIENYVFGDKKLEVPVYLRNKLRSDPWSFSPNEVLPIDSILDFARAVIIHRLFSADTMERILEYHEKVLERPMTVKMLFERFYQLIFADIEKLRKGDSSEISAASMESQRVFLNRLLAILSRNRDRREVVLYARHCVEILKADLEEALRKQNSGRSFDQARNVQHVRDLLSSIEEYERTVYVKH